MYADTVSIKCRWDIEAWKSNQPSILNNVNIQNSILYLDECDKDEEIARPNHTNGSMRQSFFHCMKMSALGFQLFYEDGSSQGLGSVFNRVSFLLAFPCLSRGLGGGELATSRLERHSWNNTLGSRDQALARVCGGDDIPYQSWRVI